MNGLMLSGELWSVIRKFARQPPSCSAVTPTENLGEGIEVDCGRVLNRTALYPRKVRMTVLASGSRGNATMVAAADTAVLVDAGLSCREILKRMAATGEDPGNLDAILIT